MTNRLATALKNEDSRNSVSITENGALGYARTNSHLVDFFFKVGSMRDFSEEKIGNLFGEVYAENPRRALELMFFVRDVRGGMGEKKVFKACFSWLVENFPGDAIDLMGLIPEYGSWKSFIDLTDTFKNNSQVERKAMELVRNQWIKDIESMKENGTCSLLAKWLPSENASSSETARLAWYWRNALELSPKTYRKALTKFRKAIRIVEADMSSGNWSEIDYNKVPSKAGMLYRNAFLKHDGLRRRKWLEDLSQGKDNVKINTTGLTVAEMVSKYLDSCPRYYNGESGPVEYRSNLDETIEAAWRDLVSKNMLPEGSQNFLPLIDGSGSMYWGTPSGNRSIDVAIGLGLFLANTNTQTWKGMMMAYGSKPEFYQVPIGSTLRSQIGIAASHNDCGSTNIEAVYDLLLETVVKNKIPQNEIPALVVFSDMEFNAAMWDNEDLNQNLFNVIKNKWTAAGYKLPKQIFWNINSRTGTIPMTENELGVGLLSGYSQAIMKMVLSRKLDPLGIILEALDSPRYNLVREALKS